jgi:hypothetical protein
LIALQIVLNFKVARYDREKGIWITERRKLFWMYLRSTFLIDFISTVPWDLLSMVIDVGKNVKLMRLLKLMKMAKLVRIYKSSRMFKKMKSKLFLKSSEYNLLKYFMVFIFALHWTACAWGIFPQLDTNSAEDIYVARRLKGGSTAIGGYFDGRNWIERMSEKMGHDLSAFDKYALSIDYALSCMCMGYGTIDAKTVSEVWFSIICMMLAGAVYAYVIGGICEALSNEDPASKQFREAMDMLNGFFRKQSVPEPLRQRCHTYMEVYRQKIQDSVYNRVLQLFPQQLQQDLAVTMMTTMVQDAQVLKWAGRNEETFFKKELALHFQCDVYPMQESIFKQGDVSTAMYVVCKGLVRCASTSSSSSVSLFAQGHCFGWEMIRNVAFNGNKYKRINSADSFTVVLLQKLEVAALTDAIMKPELSRTRKRIKRAAHWCLVRQCVVALGESVLIVKAAAGLPRSTPQEKRRIKAFYSNVAQEQEDEKVQSLEPPVDVLDVLDGEDPEFALSSSAEHVERLRKFGGGFLERLHLSSPNTKKALNEYVSKDLSSGFCLSDVVQQAQLARRSGKVAGRVPNKTAAPASPKSRGRSRTKSSEAKAQGWRTSEAK